jgi:class 3 adenylate cyclase
MDRRQALAKGLPLPDRAEGAAVFADISGFTSLTEALARDLGPQRGAEELTYHLSRVYDALICELDRYGGSVIGFAGDAITCWLDGDDGLRATACALDMHRAMERFSSVALPSGGTVSLGMKVAVATGNARRFLVGDPALQVRDVLAGSILDRLAAAEHEARRGEILLDPDTTDHLASRVRIREWRVGADGLERYGVVDALLAPVTPIPWGVPAQGVLDDQEVRPFLLRPIYERLTNGQGDFLAELRPAVALFLQFGGIDYDHDADAADWLDAFIRRVQVILERYEGSLIQLAMGDKGSYIYAAFGAPQAHEDDVIRAVSAAEELRAAGEGLVTGVKLGLAQGVMRTGAYGGRTRRTYDVLGDAANLAARLMQAAEPGQVLAPQSMAESTALGFDWEALPDLLVKGKQATVSVRALVGPRLRRGREPEVVAQLPMIGREAELEMISGALAQALAGEGQVIGITGEAGMGKSRLVAEAIRLAEDQGMSVFWGQCESYGTNTSYLVWQTIWRSFFEVDRLFAAGHGDSVLPESVLAHLEAQLAVIDDRLIPRAPLLGAVINLPLPDNELTRSFDAKLRKTSLESLLTDCLRARASDSPLLLVLDECHWIDPLSHDLLEVAGRLAARLPILIVTAYRPPELHPFTSAGDTPGLRISRLPNFQEIRLTGFTPVQAEELIGHKLERFFGARFDVPDDLVQRITTRAEGNPFYIAELLNYLQDRGIDPHDTVALGQLDLPASLHRLILARIDQLTESQRTTLRVASVIGRQFRAAIVWGACPQCGEPERITEDLGVLSRLELTLLEGESDLTYLFKHIVTQEVAYESLPFAVRSMLHNQIGEFLEEMLGDEREQYLDLLAFHFDRTDNIRNGASTCSGPASRRGRTTPTLRQ